MNRARSLTAALIATLLLASSAVLPAAAASWSGATRISSAFDADAALDGDGRLHVVTGSYRAALRYSTNASGAWLVQDVTHHTGDMDPSIAVSGGKAYIAFVRLEDCQDCAPRVSTGIMFATNRGGSWVIRRLTNDHGVSPAIRVRNGRARVAYNDGKGVRYLTEGASSWTSERVWKRASGLGTILAVANVSLALDSHGAAHIAFDRAEDDPEVRGGVSHATNQSGSWKTTNLHNGFDTVDRIVLDSTGRPHIGFTEWRPGHGTFRILRRSGSSWRSTTAPGSGWGSFSMDGHDRYEVVFVRGSRLTWYAQRASRWISDSWTATDLEEGLVRATDGGRTYVVYTTWGRGEKTLVRIRD